MVLCLLATDDEEDVALQIHFTLIQAFCCENDINILRVSNMRRLAEILGGVKPGGEPADLHCVLVTVSLITHVRLLSAAGIWLISLCASNRALLLLASAAGPSWELASLLRSELLFAHFSKEQMVTALFFPVQNPQASPWKDPALSKLNRFCRDCRCLDQWVPVISLPDR